MPVTSVKTKILVVEDDPAVLKPIQMLFDHYDFEVRTASTLAEGVRLMSYNPAIIVLDLQLPDGDGASLLQMIRQKGLPNKVFVLSGDMRPEVQRRIRRLVPNKIFAKPFNFMEILDAVRATVDIPADAAQAKSLNFY